jgi:N-acetylglucosaminyldiphosphoundecaprenol N-acetyl-beta-D-mannosaminyltransferase
MLETIKATQGQPQYRHFLFGGKQSTLDKLCKKFGEEHPDSTIAGSSSPPFGQWPDDEIERICDKIRDSGANLVWVGLGCPKQEHWIAKNKYRLPPGVYFGIGAAFAFHAGEVSQAPAILQKCGLEWAYRIAAEPRRLFKRYLVHNSLFVWYSLLDHSRGS